MKAKIPPCVVYFANNTTSYHGGSFAVCEYIQSSIAEAGWSIRIETDSKTIEKDQIADCDAVLVNGEGTLHSDKPRARHLLEILRFAQSIGKMTILCNTSWSNMSQDFDSVLKRLTQFSVRDAISAAELERKHGVRPEMHLDCSYWHPEVPANSNTDIRFLITDLYSREFDCYVRPMGGPLASIPFLDMREISWRQTLSLINRSRVILTGRFHGFMAACKMEKRFIVYPGNTHKIEGVLQWFGNTSAVETDSKKLLETAKMSHRNSLYYEELFSWMRESTPWRFPL